MFDVNVVKSLTVGVIALSFLIAAYTYPLVPEKLATHWNAAGEVDGYMQKSLQSAFFLPGLMIILVLLFFAIPHIDPLKANIMEFRPQYDLFILVFTSFMLLVQTQTILWNLGYMINPFIIISPGLAGLFYFIGFLMEKSKRNWFIGIRTPWTMSDDTVWEKTNKVGAKLFKIAAVLSLACAFIPEYAVYLIIALVLLAAAYTVLYSYLEYQKLHK
jgi:uncharacterized membrane protein